MDARTAPARCRTAAVILAGWAAGLLVLSQSALAQSAQPPATPIHVAGWTVSGSIRLRFEDWDFFKAQTGDNAYGYGASLLRVSAGRQFHSQDWLFELCQPTLIGLPSNAIAPAPQGQLGFGGTYFAANPDRKAGAFLKQAFLRFKGIGGDPLSNLRIGRFEYADGLELLPEGPLGALVRDRIANRLIGNFGFTHVGRSLDGIHFSRGVSEGNITFLAARPTEGVFQVKGMKELNIEIVYGAWTKTTRAHGNGEARVFSTYYRDDRDVQKQDNRPAPVRTEDHKAIDVATIGGNYAHVFDTGRGKPDVLFWSAIQTGSWGLLRHRAYAAAIEGGYLFDTTKFTPWLRGGYFRGSGDDDPSDRTHRTFFQELPTPRPFARFPLYNFMNNEDAFGQVTFNPHSKWTIRSEAHSLNLASAQDLWYIGGGAFQKQTFGYTGRPSGGHKGFADIFDASADYQIDSQTTITLYAAHAAGKDVVRNLFPNGKDANLVYIELLRRF